MRAIDSDCASCGQPNPLGAKFCIECGAAFTASCPGCGTHAPAGRKFCAECGFKLIAASSSVTTSAPTSTSRSNGDGERKQVTVLFADVMGSMDLAEQLGPDELSQVMSGLFDVCREAVEHFGGTVDKFTGDGIMAIFGAPVAQEDHARRACYAALRLVTAAQEYALTLRQRGVELAVRVGLNSGEVVAGSVGSGVGGAFTAVGHTVGLAQRMESLATPGVPYLSEHTAMLVADGFVLRGLGKTAVKGSTTPVGMFALEGASGGSAAAGRGASGSGRLVGRDSELATVAAALAKAQDGHFQVLGIVGEAGAGKSRLCEELARLATERGVTVGHTSGVSHAQSAALLPILGLLRHYFGIAADDSAAAVRERIATRLLGLEPELEPELGLIFDFLEVPDPARPAPQLGPDARRRRILETFARVTRKRSEHQTVMFLLEDLHWFDPHSVTFLNSWLATFPGTHTLVVTNFRPEFHAPWAAHSYYHQLPLAPLDGAAAGELLTDLLGPDAGLSPLAEQLRARSGGNPFFTEELVRGLAGDGTLTGEPGAYTLARPAHAIRVPATVQAVLSARIDRLTPAEKSTLQAASVIGRTCTTSVLGAVLSADADGLIDGLATLCAAELLQQSNVRGEYRFWHPLTQEVAYGTLLGATRRRLHQGVAETLAATDPGRHDEIAALVVTHFDAAGCDLDAARWQVRAGARASRSDWAEAALRWRSAIEHLDAAAPTTDALRLRVKAQSFLLRAGGRTGMDRAELDRMSTEARAAAERLQDPGLLGWMWAADGAARIVIGDHRHAAVALAEGNRQAELAGDTGLCAWTLCAMGLPIAHLGPLRTGLDLVESGIALCAGDPAHAIEQSGYSVHDFGHCVSTLLMVPAGPLGEARARIEHTNALFEQRPVADWRSWTLARFAHLAECTGERTDVGVAARAAEEAVHVASDSGSTAILVAGLESAALVALLQGRPDEALATFDRALETVSPHGSGALFEPSVLAHRARALLALGSGVQARTSAEDALTLARHQGAKVVECFAQVARAQIWRETATGDVDLDEARAAVAAGKALAAETGAATYAALLAEERARLEPDPAAQHVGLKLAADAYTAIGATGHARRLHTELATR